MFANHRKCSLCSVRTNIAFPYTKCIIIIIIIITVLIKVVIVVLGGGGGGGGGGKCLDFGALFYFFLSLILFESFREFSETLIRFL